MSGTVVELLFVAPVSQVAVPGPALAPLLPCPLPLPSLETAGGGSSARISATRMGDWHWCDSALAVMSI